MHGLFIHPCSPKQVEPITQIASMFWVSVSFPPVFGSAFSAAALAA